MIFENIFHAFQRNRIGADDLQNLKVVEQKEASFTFLTRADPVKLQLLVNCDGYKWERTLY